MIQRPVLHHVTVEVPQELVSIVLDFYRDVLGLTHGSSPVSNSEWFEQGVHVYWGDDVVLAPEPPAPRHFALVFGADRYKEVHRQCKERGFLITDGTPYWGSPRCFVKDPAGNRVELMEWAP
jgi:catechol 2,3-dioxygenase-like lactoylglutathione lyase family enzyme